MHAATGLLLHAATHVLAVSNSVSKVDEKLSKAALRGCVVSEDGGEGGIAKWFWQAVSEGFSRSVVVT